MKERFVITGSIKDYKNSTETKVVRTEADILGTNYKLYVMDTENIPEHEFNILYTRLCPLISSVSDTCMILKVTDKSCASAQSLKVSASKGENIFTVL